MEEKLKETMAALQRSNTELEQFAYITSHDLQEPLRMITSFAQLLENRYQGKLDKDADEFIGFITSGTMQMQNMINDLLLYSRVGTQEREFKPVNLEAVLEDVKDDLQIAIQESKATINQSSLPTINADEAQMIQLFQNLVGNAIKFQSRKPPVMSSFWPHSTGCGTSYLLPRLHPAG